MVDEYGEESALEKSIEAVKEALQRILEEDLNPEGDKEEYEFYKHQLDSLNSL